MPKNKINDRDIFLLGSSCGSVMMEYIIMNVFVIALFVAAGHFFFPADSSYGNLGNAYLERFHLMLQMVSMPFP